MSAGIAALVLAARLILAAVFAAAAATKLADRAGTRAAVVAFGGPTWAAGPVALVLPLAELVAAALLLPARTAAVGAAVCLILLAVFSVAIGYNLARGRAPECHCFGQLHSAPASWRTLARNCVLAALAVFVLVGSLAYRDRSAVAWIGRLQPAELVTLAVGGAAAAALLVGGLAFLSLLRSYGRVLLRLERVEQALGQLGVDISEPAEQPEIGLQPGSPAPAFDELDELLAPGLPLLLLFTSPSCVPCRTLVPDAARWQREHAESLTIAVASDGPAADVYPEAEEFELQHVFVDTDRRLYDAFEASGTPSAVLIAPDGSIGSWVAAGRDWIEELLALALAGRVVEQPGLPVGASTPALELRSLDGQAVALTDFQGRDTVLLFWNPHCGFCQAMHPDVLAWEQSANGKSPRLVVVSLGDADSTRQNGFASTVLLDGSFAAGEAFGATGTPMAVLVGADGRVASDVVVGTDDVLALMRNRRL